MPFSASDILIIFLPLEFQMALLAHGLSQSVERGTVQLGYPAFAQVV
jgi:hypothetical protein